MTYSKHFYMTYPSESIFISIEPGFKLHNKFTKPRIPERCFGRVENKKAFGYEKRSLLDDYPKDSMYGVFPY